MQKLFLIDASGYLYRNYFAIRNMTNSKGESTNALFGFIRSTLKLFRDFEPDHVACIFDGPRNSLKREAIYKDYKAHRSVMPPDLTYQMKWAHDFCRMMGIPELSIEEVEADDTMGSVAVWAADQGAFVYLCTSDKDLCQFVNDRIHILNTFKDNLILDPAGVEKTYGVPPQKIVDLLAMVGDSSDNIPGLPGFGEKTAAALLQSMGSLDYILSHPEEVPGKKKQETIQLEKDKALLSRRLLIIEPTVDFPKNPEFFCCRPPEMAQLREFFAQMNFQSLIREMPAWKSEKSSIPCEEPAKTEGYLLVNEEKSFQDLIAYLSKQKEICFVTATSTPRPFEAELVGVSFSVEPKKAWYIPLNGSIEKEFTLQSIKTLFENPKISFYCQNAKYELHVLNNHGINLQNISFDLVLASYILDSSSRQHSVDNLALQYFDKIKTTASFLVGKGKHAITMDKVSIEKASDFYCEDVDYTYRLTLLLQEQLKERKLTGLLMNLELPLLKILAKMERKGIYLDVPVLKSYAGDINRMLHGLEQQIFTLAGEEFNLNSSKKLQEVFKNLSIKLTKKNLTGYSTDAEVLEELSINYPIARLILEYRTLEKLRTTYIEALPEHISPKDHRIHCTFNQTVAATGRLSCQDPNLQNIPLHSEVGRGIRAAFRPEKKGWSYLAADYSQIELRLLAHLSEDPALMQAFQNHEDIHVHTAATIYNIPLDQVTKEQRQSAKAVNFGIVYGQQAWGLAKQLKIEPKEAAIFIEKYFARFSKVKDFLESCRENARNTGKAVTYTGRERPIPEIHSRNAQIRSQAERLAINTPIQGTAADLIKLAMLRINEKLSKEKKLGYMILQIHDELIFEVPDFEIIDLTPMVKEAMQEVLKLKVPLIVDISIGKNWKEC